MPPLAKSTYDRLVLHNLKQKTIDELEELGAMATDAPADFLPYVRRSVFALTELLEEINRYLYGTE